MSVAAVIVAHAARAALVKERVLPSVLRFLPEVYVVGDFEPGAGYTYLPVPAITATTLDALVKRDVGTLASKADWLFYLSDDHALRAVASPPSDPYTIVVPRRFCLGHDDLNMGFADGYCGGHGGLFSRKLIQQRPWTSMPHSRIWDVLSSREFVKLGAKLSVNPTWIIEDLTPETEPWK